jgi:acyl-CoA synthetase (AMP-forming)/AMP-acid ligase II
VLLALPNTPATVIAGLAINTLGAISFEVARDWGVDALADVVARSDARHAFIWDRDAITWRTALSGRRFDAAWVLGDGPRAAAAHEDTARILHHLRPDGRLEPEPVPVELPAAGLDPDQAALVLFTSGSSGRPNGVIQTFRNVDANSRSIVEYLGLGPDDRALLALPLSYCYGRSVLQTHLLAGGSIVLDSRMAFPRTVLETMAAEGCTGFAGVPLTFEVIRRQVDVSSIAFPRLRYLTQAGGAMATDTIDWVRDAFAPARLYVMYGQTEATARLSYLPPDAAATHRGSIGIPIPGVELRVVDEGGRDLPPGEVGEIVARGANVTPGYFDDPEGTAAILREGWLLTGDLAEQDADGFLYHRGRAKDILKVGGHRVSPIEIEHVLASHPDVAEAVVVGVPDQLLGEVPLALVVPRTAAGVDEQDLLRHCRERLPANRTPARVKLVASLPRNESGKLLRREAARLYGLSSG